MAGGAERLAGFWLPGLEGSSLSLEEQSFGPGGVTIQTPRLTTDQLDRQLDHLLEARTALTLRPVRDILSAIEAAAALTRSSHYDELLEVLPALTGYSTEMIELGLAGMGRNWTAAALIRGLEGEVGDIELLDGFRARPAGGLHRAFGPRLTVHVFSGNIPGVSVSSLIRSLSVKSPSFGKTAAGEPYLAVCFCRALAEVDAELGRCLAVTHWPGGQENLEEVAFRRAGAVVAYGADSTISAIRRRVPVTTRFLGYPNRVGAAIVRASVLNRADDWARRAADDVVTFDQQGCVSPHVLFVEKGGAVEPAEFAERLADAVAQRSRQIPRGVLSAGESSAIHQLRGAAEMRGALVWTSSEGTEWTVIFEDEPEFELSPLNRLIHVRAVTGLEEVVSALGPMATHLQTVGVACDEAEIEEVAERLGFLGATRIVWIGEGAWPAPTWHHDGRFQFLDLLRFTDIESS